MHAQVIVELGMERDGELRAFTRGDDAIFHLGKDFNAGLRIRDLGGADKRHRNARHACTFGLGMEASQLAAIGVALGRDVHRAQARRAAIVVGGKVAREQDKAGAGCKRGHAIFYASAQALEHTELLQKLALHGGFASG